MMRQHFLIPAVSILAVMLQTGCATPNGGGASVADRVSAAETFYDGLAAEQRLDYAGAMARYRDAAEHGDARGQARLGLFYATGRGGLTQDVNEAARLFRLAADQGNAFGQGALGGLYATGRGGVTRNDQEAVRLLRLSADQGDEVGEINLGICYLIGLGGLDKDEQEALRLFRLAGPQDETGAQVIVLYRK
jgi:TPR repeat protein